MNFVAVSLVLLFFLIALKGSFVAFILVMLAFLCDFSYNFSSELFVLGVLIFA